MSPAVFRIGWHAGIRKNFSILKRWLSQQKVIVNTVNKSGSTRNEGSDAKWRVPERRSVSLIPPVTIGDNGTFNRSVHVLTAHHTGAANRVFPVKGPNMLQVWELSLGEKEMAYPVVRWGPSGN